MGALHQNRQVRAKGQLGHLRWVVRGRNGSAHLALCVSHISLFFGTERMLAFRQRLKTAIKNSVSWSFGFAWANESVAPVLRRVREEDAQVIAACRTIRIFCPKCQTYCLQALLAAKFRAAHSEGGPQKPKWISKIASDTMRCVERRLIYASAVGLADAFSHDFAANREYLTVGHDTTKAAMHLSADIAKALYSFVYTATGQYGKPLCWWRRCVPHADVPWPLLAFLKEFFPDTDWDEIIVGDGVPVVKVDWTSRERLPRQVASSSSGVDAAVAVAPLPAPAPAPWSPNDWLADELCYYARSRCLDTAPAYFIRMLSSKSPRWRAVCTQCFNFLRNDGLIDMEQIYQVVIADGTASAVLLSVESLPPVGPHDVCTEESCYYSDSRQCTGSISFYVRMQGSSTKRRWRYVCLECFSWLQQEDLLDVGQIREVPHNV